ncbi:acetate--CoA ligase family protein, partial [Streptomyces sp. SID14515]|uniref:acetate--CoA ligase family protein n=1 Tax=Streptomyces sp. SID14515 TaxID=2706074 RepID=UPI001EF17EEE
DRATATGPGASTDTPAAQPTGTAPATTTPAAQPTGTAPATTTPAEATTSGTRPEATTPGTPPEATAPATPAAPDATTAPEATTGQEAAPGPGRIPAYPAAERAVRALAEAVKYAQWRRQAAVPGKIPEFLDDTIDEPGAAALIEAQLATAPDPRGRPLTHDEARELLGRYGIAVRPTLPAPDPETAVAAAARLGYPVALKTTAPHLRHRADLGGVRLDLADEEALRRAYGDLTDLLGKPAELLPVVQAMAPRGVDTVVRASIDAAAGAVLSFGLAGAPSELLGDTAHRLVPATDRDAAELIRSIRAAPVLFGWRGSAPVDTAALEELLLRLSRLVDDHPEVVSVALEPVVVAPQGLTVLGASVRLAPPPARSDVGPRRLPNY